jgi:hypothetical protein
MKKIFISFLFLYSTLSMAFTLVSSPAVKFSTNEITVNVATDSCATLGITTNTLLDWVEEVAETYWSSVSTSALVLKRGSILSTSINSATTFSAAVALANPGTILIGCSTNATLFTASDTSIGGIGGISSSSNGEIRGGLLLNGNGNFSSLSESQQKATLAHELGHAIGIGHSSDPVALMYYSTGAKLQERLTNDDKDAVTYLYPHDGPPGSCGTIAYVGNSNDKNGPQIMSLLLLMMAMLAYNYRKVKFKIFS